MISLLPVKQPIQVLRKLGAQLVTHVFLSEKNGVSIIAFEGTSSLKEWAIDFNAVPLDTDFFSHEDLGLVHAGWWQDVESVADEIFADIVELHVQGKPLACTGHSKGAAEALIFAALAKKRGITWEKNLYLWNTTSGISEWDYYNR